MKLQFLGTFRQFQSLLADQDIFGRWEEKPHGVHLLRCSGNLQVQWSSTKGTVWFSGGAAPFDIRPDIIRSAVDHWNTPSAPTIHAYRSSPWGASAENDDTGDIDLDNEDFGLDLDDYDEEDDG